MKDNQQKACTLTKQLGDKLFLSDHNGWFKTHDTVKNQNGQQDTITYTTKHTITLLHGRLKENDKIYKTPVGVDAK